MRMGRVTTKRFQALLWHQVRSRLDHYQPTVRASQVVGWPSSMCHHCSNTSLYCHPTLSQEPVSMAHESLHHTCLSQIWGFATNYASQHMTTHQEVSSIQVNWVPHVAVVSVWPTIVFHSQQLVRLMVPWHLPLMGWMRYFTGHCHGPFIRIGQDPHVGIMVGW